LTPSALYTPGFYSGLAAQTQRSAEIIVPFVLDELPWVRSVLDVGCGLGQFLEVFKDHGAEKILGLDGAHVPQDQLRLWPSEFRATDLSKPFWLDRVFDLAISLEVAEHLPESSAEGFVRSLARHAPAVLFSAAIPGQGGTGHVNCQWPSYWAALFRREGFLPVDAIRPRIRGKEGVAWWYQQNTLLFFDTSRFPRLDYTGDFDALAWRHPHCG